MTTLKDSFRKLSTRRRVSLTLALAATLAVALTITGAIRAYAQTCRAKTNIANLVDLNATTVTNLGGNNFKIHFAFVSDPTITLICADSGLTPPCGFDGAYFRADQSGNIISESGGGSCNLKSTITTTGGNFVVLGYEMRFEQNGNPSKQLFGPAGMSTDPAVIPVGTTLPLSRLLL
jgi:hypothetical protein